MKHILRRDTYIVVFILISFVSQAQIINIPDPIFKARLLQADSLNSIATDSNSWSIRIDINGNNEIEQSEALRVYYFVNISDSNITSMEGITSFSNLRGLNCVNTKVTSLNLNGLNDMTYLNCTNNNLLTSLSLSGLTNLNEIQCISNQLTSLDLSGLTKLIKLRCNGNQLTTLDLSNLINLKYLDCSYNPLTSLNLTVIRDLEEFYCTLNNQLTSLNLSSLTNLNKTFITNNTLLSAIYMKDGDKERVGKISMNYIIADNPNLRFICADDSDIAEIQYLLQVNNQNNVTINSFCSSSLDDNYYTLNINTKFDSDSNGCTSADGVYPYLKIKINNATDSGFAFGDAQSNFAVYLDTGTYTITPQLPNAYFISSPVFTTITLPEDSILQQFCIIPFGIHHDVSVMVVPFQDARPGFSDAKYKLILKNIGNKIESGSVVFNYDEDKQDYISSIPFPNNLTNGSVTYDFNNLQIFETREIIVTMRTNAPTDNPAVNEGDVLVLSVIATLNNIDESMSNNVHTIYQTVTGSFDPNDKTCLEGNIITPNMIGKDVHYLIRFENTGTAPAENIVVVDYIDLDRFDITTLEVVSSSHSCKTILNHGNKLQFVFDNINLPFTEPGKHGYVVFKIKTKNTLVIGDTLKNKASIYFDYNLPIQTNTATSVVSLISSIRNNQQEGNISVFPNPNNGHFLLHFESQGQFPLQLRLLDVCGKIIHEQKIQHSNRSEIPIKQDELAKGIYLLQLTTEQTVWNYKIQIQ